MALPGIPNRQAANRRDSSPGRTTRQLRPDMACRRIAPEHPCQAIRKPYGYRYRQTMPGSSFDPKHSASLSFERTSRNAARPSSSATANTTPSCSSHHVAKQANAPPDALEPSTSAEVAAKANAARGFCKCDKRPAHAVSHAPHSTHSVSSPTGIAKPSAFFPTAIACREHAAAHAKHPLHF